jgi:site-specific DNA-cytosine methylase
MGKEKVVLSLFDGISCAQVVLNRAGYKYTKYFASEIDPVAIKITQKNFPETIQVGDVRFLDTNTFPHKIDLLTAGFPCGDLSLMGTRRGMVTEENIIVDTLEKYLQLKEDGFRFKGQSYLFWETIRIIREVNAKYYLIENVANMSKFWIDIISREIGRHPIEINSSVRTTQNRNRMYWTNLPKFSYPDDQGKTLDSIIPGAIAAGIRGVLAKTHPNIPNPKNTKWVPKLTLRKDGKANCLVTSSGGTNLYVKDGVLHKLSPEECEVIQTLEKGYTDIKGISKSARYKAIGNGWSIDTIVPFFSNKSLQ